MSRRNDNFDYALGVGVPTGYSNTGDTSNVTFEIVTDAGSPGGKALEIQKSGSGQPLLAWDTATDDQGAVELFETDGDNLPELWIESGADKTGYFARMNVASNTIELRRGNGSGSFTLRRS